MSPKHRNTRRKSNAIFDAIKFAVHAHTGHCRKGSDRMPYIVHPLGVAKILIEHGFSDDIVIAGVLHDTVEDTLVTLAQIRKKFGPKVTALVESASEPDKKADWQTRKQHTLEHLKSAPFDALVVACADKLDNIHSMIHDYERVGEKLFERFNEPKPKQKWYYRALAEIFMARAKEGKAVAKELFGEYAQATTVLFGSTGSGK